MAALLFYTQIAKNFTLRHSADRGTLGGSHAAFSKENCIRGISDHNSLNVQFILAL